MNQQENKPVHQKQNNKSFKKDLAIKIITLLVVALIAGLVVSRITKITKEISNTTIVTEEDTLPDDVPRSFATAIPNEIFYALTDDEKTMEIYDYNDAIAQIEEVQSKNGTIGIDDFSKKYSLASEKHHEYGDSYTFTQMYEGHPIYLGSITVTVDENKKMELVLGSYIEIYQFHPDYSKRDEYLGQNSQFRKLAGEETGIISIDESIYVIDHIPYAVFQISCGNGLYMVDAETGAVLYYDSGILS